MRIQEKSHFVADALTVVLDPEDSDAAEIGIPLVREAALRALFVKSHFGRDIGPVLQADKEVIGNDQEIRSTGRELLVSFLNCNLDRPPRSNTSSLKPQIFRLIQPARSSLIFRQFAFP